MDGTLPSHSARLIIEYRRDGELRTMRLTMTFTEDLLPVPQQGASPYTDSEKDNGFGRRAGVDCGTDPAGRITRHFAQDILFIA